MKPLLLILLLAASLYAQSTVELTGTTAAGDPIVTINSKRYIAFDKDQVAAINEKLDRLAQLEAAMPVCQKLNDDFEARVNTAIATAASWEKLYNGEHQLRLDQQAFIHKPSRVSSFLDKWYIKLPVTLAPTIVGAIK